MEEKNLSEQFQGGSMLKVEEGWSAWEKQSLPKHAGMQLGKLKFSWSWNKQGMYKTTRERFLQQERLL